MKQTAQELFNQYGFYNSYRVDYTPHPKANTQSWYTIQPGETLQEVQRQMEQRYPSHAGYTFVRVVSIPDEEEIILPPEYYSNNS
jgi:hypothetical protein